MAERFWLEWGPFNTYLLHVRGHTGSHDPLSVSGWSLSCSSLLPSVIYARKWSDSWPFLQGTSQNTIQTTSIKQHKVHEYKKCSTQVESATGLLKRDKRGEIRVIYHRSWGKEAETVVEQKGWVHDEMDRQNIQSSTDLRSPAGTSEGHHSLRPVKIKRYY